MEWDELNSCGLTYLLLFPLILTWVKVMVPLLILLNSPLMAPDGLPMNGRLSRMILPQKVPRWFLMTPGMTPLGPFLVRDPLAVM